MHYTERTLSAMSNEKQLERALLWVVYEQCVYAGKAHARLLIHGQEAFAALGLRDGCNVEEIENKLFLNGDSTGKGVKAWQ